MSRGPDSSGLLERMEFGHRTKALRGDGAILWLLCVEFPNCIEDAYNEENDEACITQGRRHWGRHPGVRDGMGMGAQTVRGV